jgi:hypothetical protein
MTPKKAKQMIYKTLLRKPTLTPLKPGCTQVFRKGKQFLFL